ncbi:MAG: hypothetical protein HQL32_12290, partial [Planctomycetes bacterium]|nr:hypothetical protein [Planctomycetota bacterium]
MNKKYCNVEEGFSGALNRSHFWFFLMVFLMAVQGSLFANPGQELIMESGQIESASTANWLSIPLKKSYASPIIIVTLQYDKTQGPFMSRVHNVSSSSFDLKIANATSASGNSNCKANYFVVEEGVYTVAEHGITMEAVRYDSTHTDRKNNWTGESRTYHNTYTSPVVLGQVMSSNDLRPSEFWACGEDRHSIPSATTLYTGKHVAEDLDYARVTESIGYLVFEAGDYNSNNYAFSVQVGPESVTGMTNSPVVTYPLNLTEMADSVHLSSASMHGSDGGWPVLYGEDALTTESISLAIDEDQWKDSDRSHTLENVAYLAIRSLPLVMESGKFEASSAVWQSIALEKSFTSPVVVLTAQYDNNTPPLMTRIQNVTATSFEAKLALATNSSSGNYMCPVQYLVVEEGVYNATDHGI